MKKLPDIYKCIPNKNIKNNQEKCLVGEETIIENNDIESTLSKVHTGLGEYNTKVKIETKDKVIETTLISKDKEKIITKDNEVIRLSEIIDITIKK